MKVLLIDHESVLGGAEKSMVSLVKYMNKESVEYGCAIAGKGEFYDALSGLGIKDIYLLRMDGWRWWETGILNRIKLIISIPLQIRNILLWMKMYKIFKPDIIHFNLTRLVEPVIAANLSRIISIMHFREYVESNARFLGGIKLHFALMRLVDYWIANSAFTFRSIEKDARKIPLEIINNGIETNEFENNNTIVRQYHSEKFKFVVAKLATLVPWKNHQAYFQIAKKICAKRNDFLFLVAGKGSNEFTIQLKELVKKLGIEDNVQFVGFVDDNAQLLQQIDFLVHTSQNESFGRIYIEAMAANTPVIALSGGAADDLIIHNETGYVFKESDLESMADKIIELAEDQTIGRHISKKAQFYVNQHFSINIHCEKILNVYKKLVTNKNS